MPSSLVHIGKLNQPLTFLQCHKGHSVAKITIQIPGVHNVLNSLAVRLLSNFVFLHNRRVFRVYLIDYQFLQSFSPIESEALQIVPIFVGPLIFFFYT